MGTLKRGILGGFSGKVGNIVGSSWKGIAVIKTLPLSVANPRTTAQTNQRSDFKATALFSSQILAGFIKPLWDRFASGMSGYNAFMQKNVPLYDRATAPYVQNFVMSIGKMLPTDIIAVSSDNTQKTGYVTYSATTPGPLQATTDIAYCVGVSLADGSIAINNGGETRDTEQVDLTFASDADLSLGIQAFLAFKRNDGTVVSTASTASEA